MLGNADAQQLKMYIWPEIKQVEFNFKLVVAQLRAGDAQAEADCHQDDTSL